MQANSFYTEIIAKIKEDNSCVDFCRYNLNMDVPGPGVAIHAPDFIRPGDTHKSFAVYDDHAYDFTTSTLYDIFDLLMLKENIPFSEAFRRIAGKSISSFIPNFSHEHDPFVDNIKRLEEDIKQWHNILLNTPKAMEYLKQRGITDDTIVKLQLGYDPKKDRIVLPFFSSGSGLKAKPRYFAGRDLSGKNDPKYLCMPTDYGCSKIPFGLQSLHPGYKRKRELKPFQDVDGEDELTYLKSSVLILTEGLIDAVSLIQDTWQVLASGGGSFGARNLGLVRDMARKYDKVVLAYDNDKAGRDFQLKMGKWLIGENIPFVCVNIPHTYEGKVVKDINDYYCAGGNFADLVKEAEPGIVYCGRQLNKLKEVYDFVKAVKGYASAWDLQTLFDALAQRTVGSLAGDPDPEDPATMDSTPLFKKGELRSVFKAASSRLTDKEVIRRLMKRHTLIYSPEGKFYEYNHRYWKQITKETVKRYISILLGEHATEGRCTAVMNLMKCELEDATPFNAQHIVTFLNGVLLLDEPDPEKRFVPHSPDFRSTFMEDFAFNPCYKPTWRRPYAIDPGKISVIYSSQEDTYPSDYKNSTWKKFLEQIFAQEVKRTANNQKYYRPNHDLIREVQKMCGYIFFVDNCLEETFMLMGKGGNGKSTFMQIIEEVVGTEFCTHLRPNRLASCFDPIVLKNSVLNICHEASKDLEGAEETLKAVTSGNPIMASYKGQDAISFRPRAKWIISANSPMDIKDLSYGFSRRLKFFPFKVRFEGEDKDVNLLDKLRREKSIIFMWMYEGYLRLKHGERFLETPEQLEEKGKVLESMDHTLTFVREMFVNGEWEDHLRTMPRLPNERMMYALYLSWCKETRTDPLPRYTAIVRIDEALSVKCPAMKIFMGTEEGRDHPQKMYVMPEFGKAFTDLDSLTTNTAEIVAKVLMAGDQAREAEAQQKAKAQQQAQAPQPGQAPQQSEAPQAEEAQPLGQAPQPEKPEKITPQGPSMPGPRTPTAGSGQASDGSEEKEVPPSGGKDDDKPKDLKG